MESVMSTASRQDRQRLKLMTDYTLHRRAQKAIAQGYLTNSKRPESHIMGVYPTHLKRGQGCYVWDHRGTKYLDFITGLGSNLLGYSNTLVNAAAIEAIQDGNLLSLGTEYEIKAAEKLKELVPFVEVVKFLKTGSEACAAAVRIARAKTGREIVLSEGYHGWSDGFVSLTPPGHGVPHYEGLKYYRLKDYDITEDVAAVIVEPIMTDLSQARIEWLIGLKERCKATGTLLIFDEIITGFRVPKYTVSSYLGIQPDILCLGKAIANGFPLSAVAGKAEIMNCTEYFVSSTYAGCMDALAAAHKTMELLQKQFSIPDLWSKGTDFINGFNAIYPEGISILGYPTRGVFSGSPEIKALFFQEACFAGMLFGPSFWFNFPLAEASKSIDVLGSCRQIINKIRGGGVKLLGEMPKNPFAQQVREIK